MSYVIVDGNLARRSLIDEIVVKVAGRPGVTAEDVLETLKVNKNIKTSTKVKALEIKKHIVCRKN